MKITDYISVKPAYEALAAVRGRMPSTETAKSWVVEPITSAWNKPAGKAVFIAAGFMATLAIASIAFKAVKSIQGFFNKRSEAKRASETAKIAAETAAETAKIAELVSETEERYKKYSVKGLRDAYNNEIAQKFMTPAEKEAVFKTFCDLLKKAVEKKTKKDYALYHLYHLQSLLENAQEQVEAKKSSLQIGNKFDLLEAEAKVETLKTMIKERQAPEKQAAE
ncbi:MAG: hypothetical protein H7A40_05840 [Chlamydiales bacterium]|nr:hypothetical protein [Chlamydiales bacterium]